ncbi:hypothetical protein [Pontibacter akesuensis]|uniref:Uncharacterized protein n=1 Tax=Pontibacter akesuensis TaxID=388950 RepID=A0A1I7FRK9_9BACT|nr:hypothetical protein [Pontibacter akesuensis]GHA60873.1 hypothetical protein GCM10007389_11440 [Pontibacter akesuensis]SFU38813.1 hypothetical protein SAMN04487941_0417 [Pontibacter akesuensis]
MEEKKNEQHTTGPKGASAKKEAAGEKKAYITGGKNRATRPEQGPDIPPEERTVGIP